MIILAVPIVAFSQATSNYEATLDSLNNNNQIDSIYAEPEFTTRIQKSITDHSFTSRLHSNDAAPRDYHVICVERKLEQIGYRISTYQQKQKVSTLYFNTAKLLESKVYFENGKPIKVEVYNDNFKVDYYLELSEGKWLTYSSKNNWKPTDEGWADYEMIKAMILKR